MTSTNDGKGVKSNQTNSQKGKSYYIELYKSLDSRLCGDCTGVARTHCVCEAWGRIHSLCSHSAPATHPHLLSWLQRHTASTVLQTEWTKCEDQHTLLAKAIDAFLEDCCSAISKRNGVAKYWEQQLQTRAQWFKSILSNPWGHPVLKALLDSEQSPCDEQILEWLKEERGVMFVTRLRQMAALKSCVDLALRLATAVMQRSRLCTRRIPDAEQIESQKEFGEQASEDSFTGILSNEAGFTPEIWEFLTDLEFVLLHKATQRSSCIDLAKQVPLRNACQLVERLHNRPNISPKEKKLWKNVKDVALLIAQVVITRCMVVPTCRGAVLMALYGCSRSIVRLMTEDQLSAASVALAAPAATAHHLHTMAAAVHKQLKGDKAQFTCQLYVRAITAGMNELEKLKLDKNKSADARFTEKTLSTWFKNLGTLLCCSTRLKYECVLTAFSVHPSPGMYEEVQNAPHFEPIKDLQESNSVSTSEFGSWATDSHTQTNFVKTSETLNLKKTQKQANVLSTAIFSEGESLGLGCELCNDLAVLLSGPRVKTLTWDMEREALLENCRTYMQKTDFGTRALSTELKYLNLDPRSFQHLPEEEENEDDVYYGIEKGYEHLVELQDPITDTMPPEVWQNVFSESPSLTSDDSSIKRPKKERKKKRKKKIVSHFVEDPLKIDSDVNIVTCLERQKINISQEVKDNNEDTNKDLFVEVEPEMNTKKDKKREEKRIKKLQDTQNWCSTDMGQEPKKEIVNKTALTKFLSMKVARKNSDLRRLIANTERMMFPARNTETRDRMLNCYNTPEKSDVESNIPETTNVNGIPKKSEVVFDGLFSIEDMSFQETQDQGIRLKDETLIDKKLLSQPSTSELNAKPVSEVKEDLKKNIKKLISFRRSNVIKEAGLRTNATSLDINLNSSTTPPKCVKNSLLKQKIENVSRFPCVRTSNHFQMTSMPVSDVSKLRNQPSVNDTPRSFTKSAYKSAGQQAYEDFVKSYEPNLLNDTPQSQPFSSSGEHQFQEFLKRYNNDCPPATTDPMECIKNNNLVCQNFKDSHESSPRIQTNDYICSSGASQEYTNSVSSNTPSSVEYDPMHRHFESFLKELQDSINPATSSVSNQKFDTKNVTCNTSVCAKISKKVPKKAENVPNTFSRLSYLHKNKQLENKIKPEEVNRTNIVTNVDSDLNSMLPLHFQRKGQIQLRRICKKPSETDLILSFNKKTDTSVTKHHNHTNSTHNENSNLVIKTRHNEILKDVMKTQSSASTMLSENDQSELLQLLRQQSKLNWSNNVINVLPKSGPVEPVAHSLTSNIVAAPTAKIVHNQHGYCKKIYPSNKIGCGLVVQNKNFQQPVNNLLPIEHRKINAIKIKKPYCATSHQSVISSAFKSNEQEMYTTQNTNLDWQKAVDPKLNPHDTVYSFIEKPIADKNKSVQFMKNNNNKLLEGETEQGLQTLKTQPSVKENSVPKKQCKSSLKRTKSYQLKQSDNAGPKSWESVFNDLLKHKTPNRGPNALEIALQKCKVEKQISPQTSKTNQSSNLNNNDDNDKQQENKNNVQFSTVVENTSKVLEKNENKSFLEIHPKVNDPFISGIPNSDYDLLDELMDDDLRQEIRELSDDETYCTNRLYTQTEKVNLEMSANFIMKPAPSQTSQLKTEGVGKHGITLNNSKSVIIKSNEIPTKVALNNKSRIIANESIKKTSNRMNNVIDKERSALLNSQLKTKYNDTVVTRTDNHNSPNSQTDVKSNELTHNRKPKSSLVDLSSVSKPKSSSMDTIKSSVPPTYDSNISHESLVQVPSDVLKDIPNPISQPTTDGDNSVLKSVDSFSKSIPRLVTSSVLLSGSANKSENTSIPQNTVIVTAEVPIKQDLGLLKETYGEPPPLTKPYSPNCCNALNTPAIYPFVLGSTVIKPVITKRANAEKECEKNKNRELIKHRNDALKLNQNEVSVNNKSVIVSHAHRSRTTTTDVIGSKDNECSNLSALSGLTKKATSNFRAVESCRPNEQKLICMKVDQKLPILLKESTEVNSKMDDNKKTTPEVIERLNKKRLSLLNRSTEVCISLPAIPLPYKSLNTIKLDVSNKTLDTNILKTTIDKAEIKSILKCYEVLDNKTLDETDLNQDTIGNPVLVSSFGSCTVSDMTSSIKCAEIEKETIKKKILISANDTSIKTMTETSALVKDCLSDVTLLGETEIDKIKPQLKSIEVKGTFGVATPPLCNTTKTSSESVIKCVHKKKTTLISEPPIDGTICKEKVFENDNPISDAPTTTDFGDHDTISFVELPRKPNDDVTTRKVRIKANGTTLISTICGHIDIDSMFSDPQIRNVVLKNCADKTACVLNVKQKMVIGKSDKKSFVNTIVSSPHFKYVNSDVIDLVSDDETEVMDETVFKTEFGHFTSTFRNNENPLKHQARLSQKCTVNIKRCEAIQKITASNSVCPSLPKTLDNELNENNIEAIEVNNSSNDSLFEINNPERSVITSKLNTHNDLLKNSIIKRLKTDNTRKINKNDIKDKINKSKKFKHVSRTNNNKYNVRERRNVIKAHNYELKKCFVRLIRCNLRQSFLKCKHDKVLIAGVPSDYDNRNLIDQCTITEKLPNEQLFSKESSCEEKSDDTGGQSDKTNFLHDNLLKNPLSAINLEKHVKTVNYLKTNLEDKSKPNETPKIPAKIEEIRTVKVNDFQHNILPYKRDEAKSNNRLLSFPKPCKEEKYQIIEKEHGESNNILFIKNNKFHHLQVKDLILTNYSAADPSLISEHTNTQHTDIPYNKKAMNFNLHDDIFLSTSELHKVKGDSISKNVVDDVPLILVDENQRLPPISENHRPYSIIKDYTKKNDPLQTLNCCAEWFTVKPSIHMEFCSFRVGYRKRLSELYIKHSTQTSKAYTVCNTDWFLTKSLIHNNSKPVLDIVMSLHQSSVEVRRINDEELQKECDSVKIIANSPILSLLTITTNYINNNSAVIEISRPVIPITPQSNNYSNRKRRMIKRDKTSEIDVKPTTVLKKLKHEFIQNHTSLQCHEKLEQITSNTSGFNIGDYVKEETKVPFQSTKRSPGFDHLNRQKNINNEKMFYSKIGLPKKGIVLPKENTFDNDTSEIGSNIELMIPLKLPITLQKRPTLIVKDLVSQESSNQHYDLDKIENLNKSNQEEKNYSKLNFKVNGNFKSTSFKIPDENKEVRIEFNAVDVNKNSEELHKILPKTDKFKEFYDRKQEGTTKISLNTDKNTCQEPSNLIEKKVTLLCKSDDSDLILKGTVYKDPLIGTCFLFPISRAIKSTITVVSKVDESVRKEINLSNGVEKIENLNVLIPKLTYTRQGLNSNKCCKTKNSLKRKSESLEYNCSSLKRHRKARNIDYPTEHAHINFAYDEKLTESFKYWESVKFSFSRPIENWDVGELHKFWPIQGALNLQTNKPKDDIASCIYHSEYSEDHIYDPLRVSLAEEIASEGSVSEYETIETNETNYSMGFGERSDRVIQRCGDQNTLQKTSAATLSDVKPQPFSASEYSNIKFTNKLQTHKDNIEVTKRFLNYITQKNKVRSFFKKTNVELNLEWMSCSIKDNGKKCKKYSDVNYPFEVHNYDFFNVPSIETIVHVVQVGQLPVSAAAQNPVTCDPRVTQVTDASPPQCSAENSPQDGSQTSVKTEYTELTTADLSLPVVEEYGRENNQAISLLSQGENNKLTFSDENIPIEKEVNSIVKIEIAEETLENEEEIDNEDSELQKIISQHTNNREFCFTNSSTQDLSYQNLNDTEPFMQGEERNEKTDQIAHAMSAAGITTNTEQLSRSESQTVDVIRNKINEETTTVPLPSSTNYSKAASINAISLQQALAQILPPPLNRTNISDSNQQNSNQQVLHLVQGKHSNSVNQLTLMDSTNQTVLNTSNSTPVLHIVQNKGQANNTNNTGQLTNSFNGLPLVDNNSIQHGSSQLLHIVNTGGQKTNNTGQLLKRVNLLTNLSNVQNGNEQKMVQFVCKSADGKSIQLNAPHQRSMVLRIQPFESSNVQSTKPIDNHNDANTNGNTLNTNSANENTSSQQEIKSRSVYEENYAKFIQNSGKSTITEKSTSLPKFNQAFGKQVYQDENQKVSITENHSHLPAAASSNEISECQNDNSINLEQIGQLNNPHLLLRKANPQSTSQTQPAQQSLVTQLKQTITPMNLQTMHGGVIYTRQIPVNIGGGQTINLITVPSTELIDDSNHKQQNNSSDIEPSIIKIVSQNSTSNSEVLPDESRSQQATTDTPTPQHVLTQMRIKLPMLSKPAQMVSGARVVRPSFFQIQRNVIGGANQPVYQQLVLTAAPSLGQQTIRLPQSQTNRLIKVPAENQTASESQMSSSTLEQLREFDMVLEQVKERSTVQPSTQCSSSNAFNKVHAPSVDTTDASSHSTSSSESTHQVLYTIGNNSSLNVAYVNRKAVNPPIVTTYVRSPDSSNITDSPSSTQTQASHTVTTESQQTNELSTSPNQHKAAKISTKSKSRPKPTLNPSSSVKINTVPPKPSTQKPFEDEQTTQRILYILAEYKEQVENSPDKDKPAPRRRSNPPSNPGSSKRKKSSSGSRRPGTRDMSPVHGEDTCRTMGSEDSSCGTSQGDCTESCLDSHSPQDSPRKVVRKLSFEPETPVAQPRPQPQRNVIVADAQTITVARNNTGKPTTAVLMPANYILPVSMVKSGQQIAIVTNRGPKILTVGGGEGSGNTVLLQRLIGPGMKPVLTRPGVRHVRLPAAALQNLQAFTLGTTTGQQPDSTATVVHPNPPELIDTRATSSPWAEREDQDPKPEKQSSPSNTEPWNLASHEPHDYSYEEIVRSDNMDRTVLVVHRKDGTTQRHHRLAHVSSAALRHRYAILEHELRLQKSLSEECEDLGVDSPSASELFPEAELLFSSSPAHEAPHHSHTPQPIINQGTIPQPDIDDQIATDQLIRQNDVPDEEDLNMALGLDNIVTVSADGTITLDPQEFARSHPNTTFHKEPTDESELQPFTIANVKGRHMTSTIFHASRAPATVLVTAPQTTVISQAAPDTGIHNNLKYSNTPSHSQQGSIPSVLVKDNGVSKFDSMLNRELHLSNTASTIIHSGATQVIRRVCYDDDKHDTRFLESHALMGEDAKMADDSRDATLESMADVDDDRSSPERNEMFWESNSTSERSEGRRPLDFSSDSDKCCKSPFEETNSTDSSGIGTHIMRLDSVIKDARGIERSGSADGSSADDTHPPLRTYPPKRYHPPETEERSTSGKTRAGERSPDSMESRRRASNRGVVKRGCHCCNGSPAPSKPKKSRPRKPNAEFST